MKVYSPYHFAVVRISLGVYLSIHFAQLVPWSAEMFSVEGVFSDRARLLFLPAIPVTPGLASLFLWTLSGLALLFAAGIARRLVAAALWYGWACLFHLNDFIGNPSYPYVGWLLLACVLIPGGEALALGGRRLGREVWRLPGVIFWGAWMVLALGYCAGGVHKLGSPSWLDGTAMQHALTLPPLARSWYGRWLLVQSVEPMVRLSSWAIVAFETAFPVLCVFRRGRQLAWGGAVAMHLAILLAFDLADLTVAMLLFHFFVFEPRWYPRWPGVRGQARALSLNSVRASR